MKIRLLFAVASLVFVLSSNLNAQAQGPFVRFPGRLTTPRRAAANGVPVQRVHPNILQPRFSEDHGNVSVLHDDGTMIVPQNAFNLANSSLVFTPQGGGYTVQTVTPNFVNPGTNAQLIRLGGGSVSLNLPFTFKFYNGSYTTVYLNSNGNLTFGAADNNDFYFGLGTAVSGPPRIAALFDALLDQSGGGFGQIGAEAFSDHVNIYWLQVEDFSQVLNTFEIILQSNGIIRFNYGPVSATSAAVGLSPGSSAPLQTVDFSQQTSPLAFTGSIGEAFSQYADIDLGAVGQAFYQSHPDNYDGFIVFADVDGMQGAYAQPVRNATKGVNNMFDYGAFFGSKNRLFITANAGSVSQYPADPAQIFEGPLSTLTLMGQLFGHAWMSYVDTNPSSLIGL